MSTESGSKAAAGAHSTRGDGQWGRSAQSVVHKASLSGTPAFPALPSLGGGGGGAALTHIQESSSFSSAPQRCVKEEAGAACSPLVQAALGLPVPQPLTAWPLPAETTPLGPAKAAVPADPSLSPPASPD